MARKQHALEKNLPGYVSTYEDHFRAQVPIRDFEEKILETRKPVNLLEQGGFGLGLLGNEADSAKCTCSKFAQMSLNQFEDQRRQSHPEEWDYLKNVCSEYEGRYCFDYPLAPEGNETNAANFDKFRDAFDQAKKEEEETREKRMESERETTPWLRKEFLYDDALQCTTAQLYRAQQGTLILRKKY